MGERTCISSCSIQRVDATDWVKQKNTSMHRQNSGHFCSPMRPLHGQSPLPARGTSGVQLGAIRDFTKKHEQYT